MNSEMKGQDDNERFSNADEESVSLKDGQSDENGQDNLKGGKTIIVSKIIVLSILMGSAVVAGFATYTYISNRETEEFQNQFLDYAQEFTTVSAIAVLSTFSALDSFGKSITSSAISNAENPWPFVTVPHFHVRGQDFLSAAGADFIALSLIVNDTNQLLWEEYAQSSQGWIQEGLDYFAKKYQPEDIPSANPIEKNIWKYDNATGRSLPDSGRDTKMPIWQMYPPPVEEPIVNQNLKSDLSFKRLVDVALTTRKGVLSEAFTDDNVFGTSDLVETSPKSLLLQPIFQDFEDNSDIVGFLAAVIPWEVYFRNALHDKAHPVIAILKSTCEGQAAKSFTFLVNRSSVEFLRLGPGDLHSRQFDSMKVSSAFYNSHEGLADYCDHTLHVYPSQEMNESYETDTPIAATLAVLAVFVFTLLVFIIYDSLVQRRQRKVAKEARRTAAIVTSLFPMEVHARLFGTTDSFKKQGRGMLGHLSKMKLLSDDSKTVNVSESEVDYPKPRSKPIADLFPEATVMFCDISGFTAFSSVREPPQIFILLETIYEAFDEIARRRKVFKVETIGDCYLAVAGVPKPMKGHAVAMSRFAHDCMEAFNRLCNDLVVELGPDTTDLAMRFGLHSGSVTAGVLRGEKTRFQLFGDTVNTASRMESTGVAHRIQCSEATAEYLREAGKEEWMTKREDVIHAKGKGEMTTYWVNPKSGGANSNVSCSSQEDGPTLSSAGLGVSADSAEQEKVQDEVEEGKMCPQLQRSVDWISEVLLRLLRQIVAQRITMGRKAMGEPQDIELAKMAIEQEPGRVVLDEMEDIIFMPKFDPNAAYSRVDPDSVKLPHEVVEQLRSFVVVVALMYQDNPFHNFQHAVHCTMSAGKLLARIVSPCVMPQGKEGSRDMKSQDHTYGINDPLTQFAVMFTAMIHDVDHPGVPNSVLVQDGSPLAQNYRNTSVAEQNSFDITWDLLMDNTYADLCACIFTNDLELQRFRQLVVNSVLATDIVDPRLNEMRNARWEKAFNTAPQPGCAQFVSVADENSGKATMVIEHILQASDVAHTMQHWHVYLKWNEKFFEEQYNAYLDGHLEVDPSEGWYHDELEFFDRSVIPLAKKLKDCGVFGISGTEYLTYAFENRREWERRGRHVVQKYLEKYGEGDCKMADRDVTTVEALYYEDRYYSGDRMGRSDH